jgi:hypothetical protein
MVCMCACVYIVFLCRGCNFNITRYETRGRSGHHFHFSVSCQFLLLFLPMMDDYGCRRTILISLLFVIEMSACGLDSELFA